MMKPPNLFFPLVDGDILVDMFERLEMGLIPKQTYAIEEKFFDEYK